MRTVSAPHLKRLTFGEGVVTLRSPANDPHTLMVLPEQRAPQPMKKRGHIAMPGTGPAGETCGTCAHLVSRVVGDGRHFSKCDLNSANWTGGKGSDIRRKDAACRRWVSKSGAPQ